MATRIRRAAIKVMIFFRRFGRSSRAEHRQELIRVRRELKKMRSQYGELTSPDSAGAEARRRVGGKKQTVLRERILDLGERERELRLKLSLDKPY